MRMNIAFRCSIYTCRPNYLSDIGLHNAVEFRAPQTLNSQTFKLFALIDAQLGLLNKLDGLR